MTAVAPIRREILVAGTPERAFDLFTGQIGAWWPLAKLSVFGNGTVVCADGVIVERSEGRESVWAEVLEWDPPRSLHLNWHPGGTVDSGTDVRVRFSAAGDRTLVSVEQSGWERLADPAAAAAEYGHGWPIVLDAFADSVTEPTEPKDQWFALVHRPGPALPAGASIFEAEAFGEHVAFLRRLDARGLLVAAGPLPEQPGAGMTIVRVRPAHGDIDIRELARIDDKCVLGGFLDVTVDPWLVMFTSV